MLIGTALGIVGAAFGKVIAIVVAVLLVVAAILLAVLPFRKSDYDLAISLRSELQSFIDELGSEPQPNYRVGRQEFNQRLHEIGSFERKLTNGFQLRFASRVQTLIHRAGEKNVEDADLILAMRQPPKTLAALLAIRDGLSALAVELEPK